MKLKFDVTGMTCAACSARVEKVTNAVEGVEKAEVNLLAGTMQVQAQSPDVTESIIRAVVNAGSNGVKFHLLHVLRGTDLAEEYAQKKVSCLSLEEYGRWLKACVDVLPEDIVVHRITGDGAKRDLIAPLWSVDKKRVLNYLHKVLEI